MSDKGDPIDIVLSLFLDELHFRQHLVYNRVCKVMETLR